MIKEAAMFALVGDKNNNYVDKEEMSRVILG